MGGGGGGGGATTTGGGAHVNFTVAVSRRLPFWPIAQAVAVCGPVARLLNVAASGVLVRRDHLRRAAVDRDLVGLGRERAVVARPRASRTRSTALQASAESVSPFDRRRDAERGRRLHVQAPRNSAATAIGTAPGAARGMRSEVGFTSVLLFRAAGRCAARLGPLRGLARARPSRRRGCAGNIAASLLANSSVKICSIAIAFSASVDRGPGVRGHDPAREAAGRAALRDVHGQVRLLEAGRAGRVEDLMMSSAISA